jgi:hypothetical protein
VIELFYDQPVEGQKVIKGLYSEDGGTKYEFACAIEYNDGVMDLPATEARVKASISEAIEHDRLARQY